MNNLLRVVVFSFLVVSTSAFADNFPKNPNLEETPGKLCDTPSSKRYPEQIAYCERDVDSYTKNAVIAKYDQLFGYRIRSMNRGDFKIDHFIPLCAGGSNNEENLWPQHKSVYNITDPIEPILCEKMASGRLTQIVAIQMIKEAKIFLDRAPVILKEIKRL